MPYYFYILQSQSDGSYYLGQTSDLEDRLNRHNEGRSRYTRARRPWRLVYSEEYAARAEAMRREREVKGKRSRTFIESLTRTFDTTLNG